MMAYAYFLYDSPGPGLTPLGLTSVPIFYPRPESDGTDYIYRNRLLPLLLALLDYHPEHLPILLLLACTYYALGDFDASLSISHRILSLDPEYVEAMSNIGTTMKALNQTEKAYEWWWKALQIRPTYWDALVSLFPHCMPDVVNLTMAGQHPRHDFHSRPQRRRPGSSARLLSAGARRLPVCSEARLR